MYKIKGLKVIDGTGLLGNGWVNLKWHATTHTAGQLADNSRQVMNIHTTLSAFHTSHGAMMYKAEVRAIWKWGILNSHTDMTTIIIIIIMII